MSELADAARRDIIWLPALKRYGRAAAATNEDRVTSITAEFGGAVSEMEKEAQRALKLDHKVTASALLHPPCWQMSLCVLHC